MRLRNTFDRPVWWVVLSPTYEVYASDYYGTGDPGEDGRDVLLAFARSARIAKRLAIRAWRRKPAQHRHRGGRGPYIIEYPDENPMARLTVERHSLTGPESRRVRP